MWNENDKNTLKAAGAQQIRESHAEREPHCMHPTLGDEVVAVMDGPQSKNGVTMASNRTQRDEDERREDLKRGIPAAPDDLGKDPGQVGPESAGQSGSSQRLSAVEDLDEESVEELSNTDQAYEAHAVDGVEDAANHPERPVHTHLEYGRPDDVPPNRDDEDEEAA
jgi:hypothetical protein